jgi:hypothetical protein
MSEKNPGGADYIPTSTVVQCLVCDAYVALAGEGTATVVMRRHLDQNVPATKDRADRICPGSRTVAFRHVGETTKEEA